MASVNRSKSIKIADPKAFFDDWAFRIEPHHYETLGLGFRMFMKEKKASWSWAVMEPVEYWFSTGYVFYDTKNPAHFLQVTADWDATHIEVHEGFIDGKSTRLAFAVTEHALSQWLKSGMRPAGSTQLDIASSKAGLLAWEISTNADGDQIPQQVTGADESVPQQAGIE
jgi:hypothetical protein